MEIRALADQLVAQAEAVTWAGRAGDAMRERVRERAARLREAADRHDAAADSLDTHLQLVDELKDSIAEVERRADALRRRRRAAAVRAAGARPQGLARGQPARRPGPGLTMATIDLGPPRPDPARPARRAAAPGRADPARAAVRRRARQRRPAAVRPRTSRRARRAALDDRLGRSRGSDEQAAYAEALGRLHDPAASLSRRGLLVGGPTTAWSTRASSARSGCSPRRPSRSTSTWPPAASR